MREIVAGVQAHAVQLCHIGAKLRGARPGRPECGATERRVGRLLALMIARAHRGLRHAL